MAQRVASSSSPPSRLTLERASLTRASSILRDAIAAVPSETLRAVLAAAPSLRAVADLLSAAAAAGSGSDPLAGAVARSAARKEALLAEAGGALAPDAVAARTRMSRQTVSNWRRRGALIALPRGRRKFVFPACQFGDDRPLPGLDRVLEASQLRDPWARLGMLLAPSPRFGGRSPLELLRAGEIDQAVEVARDAGNPLDEGAPRAEGRRTGRSSQ
jgi:hypothetical protein